jgi:NAD(P)-dependent dehydrogenase (short-subunit alcohol dehydrogenase family)
MRTALVTGVSRGLGLHISQALKAAGYRVLGLGFTADPRNPAVDAYQHLDLGFPIDVEPFADEQIDVLINNASVYLDDPRRGYGDLLDLRVDDLIRTFAVNLFGPAQLAIGHAPRMIARRSGRIVNVSSGMGRLRDADGASFAYRSSKLALNSLTLSIARHFERAPGDLAALSFCPGWIRTSMGTDSAPIEPDVAVRALIDLLTLEGFRINGRFFRHRNELGWDIKGPDHVVPSSGSAGGSQNKATPTRAEANDGS